MGSPRWTPEENRIIERLYTVPTTTREQLLIALPGRNWGAIRCRAMKLGLVRKCKFGRPRGVNNVLATGRGKITGSFLYQMRYSAQTRNLECPLFDGSDESYDYLNSLITDKCPFSGRPLTFPTCSGDTDKTASLDRIDSSKGYVRGNVRWVHKVINIMRKDMGDFKFLELIKDIATHRGIAQQLTAIHTMPVKRLLICTIIRDVEKHLSTWAKNLEQLRFLLAPEGWQVDLSVYENDSTDMTSPVARSLLKGLGRDGSRIWFESETLGTHRYGSVWSLDRLRNLAAARQRCLDQVKSLSDYDKICYIEPDVTYSPLWALELVLAKHPRIAGIGEPDIYSGWSLRSERHPKESTFLFDTCATRATDKDTCWDVNEAGGTWRGKSLVPTNLGGVDSNCLHSVYSTFNCFCVYNAKPFITEGLKWGYANGRLRIDQNPYVGDGRVTGGWLDADTAVMCEDFRARGYTSVYLNTNVLIRHA